MTPNVAVENPLLRTPLSLIVDDSCPVVNLTYFWIRQRQAWLARHRPDAAPSPSDGDPARLHLVPETIPARFAQEWADWCGEQGIRGKFSMVPFPAGVGRLDQGLPRYPRREFENWMRTVRETIWPNFDITCEMLTHSHVIDLESWQLTEEWEQYEWVDPPVEPLTDYIAAAMTILKNAGIPCEGVTSPGAFGSKKEAAYARAILDASIQVFGNPRPFYFLRVHIAPAQWPDVPIWHPDKDKGQAIASVIGCTGDWFGNWTGYDPGDPDRFLTEDLTAGALLPVLEKELPCVLVSHWPGFYFGGDQVGFQVLQEVKRRLDRYDPDGTRTQWMKTSEIGHYWMARTLSDIAIKSTGTDTWQIEIDTRFPSDLFTLSVDTELSRVQIGDHDLHQVTSRRNLTSGTFLVEGNRTVLAFDLPPGSTSLEMWG